MIDSHTHLTSCEGSPEQLVAAAPVDRDVRHPVRAEARAAGHDGERGEERERFLERGAYFFRASTESLASFETKTYTRPVILMMHYGMMQAWFDRYPQDGRPPGPELTDPGSPRKFVPQKTRALLKLRIAAAVGGAALATGAVLLLRAVV